MREAQQLNEHVYVLRLPHLRFDPPDVAGDMKTLASHLAGMRSKCCFLGFTFAGGAQSNKISIVMRNVKCTQRATAAGFCAANSCKKVGETACNLS